jgi:nucleotide-binding universal stress UspA family protein
MLKRLFVAIDQRESRRPLIEFTAELAKETDGHVHVLHVIEFAGRGCAAPMEAPSEAERVVEQAVFELRMAGIGSDGTTRSALRRDVGSLIVEGAHHLSSDVIVLGANGGKGLRRLLGSGVRERVIRKSSIPVLVAPSIVSAKRAHRRTQLRTR